MTFEETGLDEFEPTGWWRVLEPDGKLWRESSYKKECTESMRPGDRLQRMYEKTDYEWRDEE
jgi:hypothetical protein